MVNCIKYDKLYEIVEEKITCTNHALPLGNDKYSNWHRWLNDINFLSRFCSTRTGSLSVGMLPWWSPSRLRRTSSPFWPSENLDECVFSVFSPLMTSWPKAEAGPGR